MKNIIGRIVSASSSRFSKFQELYGRHIILIYSIYIIVFSAATVIFSTVKELGNLSGVLVLLISVFALLHGVMNIKLAKNERHPYQLLYHQRLRTPVFVIATLSLLSLLLIGSISGAFSSELAVGVITLSQITGIIFLAAFSVFLVSAFFSFGSFDYHKESRLCLRLILEVCEQIVGKDENERMKIAYKNLRWFRRAFNSCNSFLIQKPCSVELKNAQNYSDVIYGITQMGDSKEIKNMVRNIELALDSLGRRGKDVHLKELLVALKYIKEKSDRRKKVAFDDLKDLYSASSRLDRAKSKIKSPFTVSAIAILGIIIAAINLFVQFMK